MKETNQNTRPALTLQPAASSPAGPTMGTCLSNKNMSLALKNPFSNRRSKETFLSHLSSPVVCLSKQHPSANRRMSTRHRGRDRGLAAGLLRCDDRKVDKVDILVLLRWLGAAQFFFLTSGINYLAKLPTNKGRRMLSRRANLRKGKWRNCVDYCRTGSKMTSV